MEEELILKIDLENAFLSLSHEEKIVIQLRFFEEHMQIEVANYLNCSQALVSRLEKKALKKLKNSLRDYKN